MSRVEDGSADDDVGSAVSVETLLASIPDAVLLADTDTGQVVSANDAAGDLFDCQPADLVGLHYSDLHPADAIEDYLAAFERAVEGETVTRLGDGSPLYVETLSGDHTPVEVTAERIEEGQRELVLGVFREVGDRLERERRLQRTTSRLETLLDATPLPVAVLDASGTVELWNRAAEETFGYASESVVGETYPLFVDESEFRALFEQVLEDDVLDGYETVHRAKDGSLVDVELYVRPLYESGTITGLVGAAIDVTDRKRRTRRLGVLHRVLRHNIRNQLTVIRGLAADLARDAETDASVAEEIVAASESLLDLSEKAHETRQVVTAAEDRDESVRVETVLATAASSLPETEDVSPPDRSVTVPARAEEAIERLVAAVQDHRDGPVSVRAESHDRHVVVEVTADEQLLPDGELAFLRTGEETALRHGSGLDVAQAALLATAVGGTLSVVDASVPGSRLAVELPRMDVETLHDLS